MTMATFRFPDPDSIMEQLKDQVSAGTEAGFVHYLGDDEPCACGGYHGDVSIDRSGLATLSIVYALPDWEFTIEHFGEISDRTVLDDWGRPLPKPLRQFTVEGLFSVDQKRPAQWIEPEPPRPAMAIDSIHWPTLDPSRVVLTYWHVPRDALDPHFRVTGPWTKSEDVYAVDPGAREARWLVCLYRYGTKETVPFISLELARSFCEIGADANTFAPQAIVERTDDPTPWSRWRLTNEDS